jgi:hypothetical protein
MTTRLLALIAALLWLISPAFAQTARVVASCNAAGYAAGPQQPLVQDVNGNLCIANVGLEQPDVTGTFTNGTQTTSVTSTSQDGFGTALITITGTYGTASAVFELSDDSGTTWFPMVLARTDGSGSETGYVSLTNVSRAWLVPVAGMDLIRIRSTAVASGTVNVRISSTSVQTSPVPVAITQISGNAAGTTGAVVGTLAAAANKTTFICGFNVQAIGGTAAVGPITVAGLVGSSQVYQGSSSAAGGSVASVIFTPCLPASAVNTAITTTTTADGTATAVDVNSWGYQQ